MHSLMFRSNNTVNISSVSRRDHGEITILMRCNFAAMFRAVADLKSTGINFSKSAATRNLNLPSSAILVAIHS